MSPLSTHATYDEVPYEGGLATLSHPQNSAVIARIFGMEPGEVASCRVLEVGCGVGQNLVPLAYSLPNSSFLGIDLSGIQIAEARRSAERLGLSNISFEHTDVRAFQATDPFDYIICHGVYSWVPADAQAAILDLCRNLLTPQGIAHISYNVLPGWHMRGAIREMMRSHARFFPDHGERVEQARALVEFLADATAHFDGASQLASAYHQMVSAELQMLRGHADYYVMHEHLAEDNHPMYFLDFVEQLRQHGLQFLGEANFASMLSQNLPQPIRETLDAVTHDHLSLEQYRDFVLNRMFRQSLVVRDDVHLKRDIDANVVRSFTARATLSPSGDGEWQVPRAAGTSSPVANPFTVAVLEQLAAARPASLTFNELFEKIPDPLWPSGMKGDARGSHLATILLSLFATDGVSLRAWDPAIVKVISDHPAVFKPALFVDNKKGTPGPHHTAFGFNSLVIWLIPLLHGILPVEKLTQLVEVQLADGALAITGLPDGFSMEGVAESLVWECLEQLRATGMLEA